MGKLRYPGKVCHAHPSLQSSCRKSINHLLITIIRPIWVGLTILLWLLWFFSTLPHPVDSRWMQLTADLPNAMMLNVLGFNGQIPEQFHFHGQNMPWLGGWQYAAYAIIVGLIVPLTACYSVLLPKRGRLSLCLTKLFDALPMGLGIMAIVCAAINLISWDAWQRFVSNTDPLVYHGMVIHGTSPLIPCLCLACCVLLLTVLQYQPTMARWMQNRWTLPTLLIGLAAMAIPLILIGQAVTGKQPAILNRDGGYSSAWFLIMSMGIWLSVHLSTRLLTVSRVRPNGHVHWAGRLAVGCICLLLSGWLAHLGMAFTDMGSTRFAATIFHRAVGMGTWIQLAAGVCLVIIAITWYRQLESHFIQQTR